MGSRSALTPHSAAPQENGVAAHAGVQSAVPVEAAANDGESTPGFSIYGDPLFGMAIASVMIFALLAALMAMS